MMRPSRGGTPPSTDVVGRMPKMKSIVHRALFGIVGRRWHVNPSWLCADWEYTVFSRSDVHDGGWHRSYWSELVNSSQIER